VRLSPVSSQPRGDYVSCHAGLHVAEGTAAGSYSCVGRSSLQSSFGTLESDFNRIWPWWWRKFVVVADDLAMACQAPESRSRSRPLPRVAAAGSGSGSKAPLARQSINKTDISTGDVMKRSIGQSNSIGAAPRLLTIKQVADRLTVSVGCLRAWRIRGEGPPAIRVGSALRWDEREVDAWLNARRESGGLAS
jgi:predicted DNA-binding transcriptional regulator AlpA